MKDLHACRFMLCVAELWSVVIYTLIILSTLTVIFTLTVISPKKSPTVRISYSGQSTKKRLLIKTGKTPQTPQLSSSRDPRYNHIPIPCLFCGYCIGSMQKNIYSKPSFYIPPRPRFRKQMIGFVCLGILRDRTRNFWSQLLPNRGMWMSHNLWDI